MDFEVAIELACADASAGAELELVFPNQTLVFAMPATGARRGTPASISDRLEAQTDAIEVEPLDDSTSDTRRIV